MSAISALSAQPIVQNAVIAIGSVPPGVQSNLDKVVNWLFWLTGVALITAFVVSMGKGGFSALRHGQMEGHGGAVVCLICGLLAVAAPTLFGVFGIKI